MDALECISRRRSIRKFKETPVSRDTIKQIVDLARFAPSWKNTQTVRYIAVCDPALKGKIASECVMGYQGNTNIINNASVLIVEASVDKRSGYERDGSFSTSKGIHWQAYDAGIAGQTFCLVAHAYGLGTVIMGVFDEAKVRECVSLAEGESVSALIALGYPDSDPAAPKRKDVSELLSFC